MKKFVALLLSAVFAVCVLAACSNGSEGTDTETGSAPVRTGTPTDLLPETGTDGGIVLPVDPLE